LILLIGPALLAGCLAPGPAPSTPVVGTPPAPRSPAPAATTVSDAASDSPSPSPSPTTVAFDVLPPLREDNKQGVFLCDPERDGDPNHPSETPLVCGDGLWAGLQAMEIRTSDPIERAWLRRPRCATSCTDADLATGTLTAWTASGVWTTSLDAAHGTATLPVPDPAASWPAFEAPVPAVARPKIPGAPAELVTRQPLPYCGHSELGRPPAIPQCFLAAVLSGRPAEVIDTRFGTEGGASLQVARFMGTGPIDSWELGLDSNGRATGWFHVPSALVLGEKPEDWSLVPFS